MGRYTTARSFDDRSTEVQAAPTEAEKTAAGKKDILEVWNVMGSTAGAGSGEFHNYRNSRRKEIFRLAKMDEDDKKQGELHEFETNKRERADAVEAAHLKRVAKRQKKKGKKNAKKSGGPAGGAAAGGDGAQEEDSDDEAGPKGPSVIGPALPSHIIDTSQVKVKEMANITIVDDD
mmetsp:Transcript_84521/g.123669  ORF Transcript_84521/g.123669 Transcript_84521/m.123669 type:complete len:176 (+) Transcript_84521:72-599(+)|eukprot:CAMPEP_0179438536 /NCGR_PEP_ID=MMETSP0799-20121207/22260_1 /TAXON_ID=46947 /ORGANISM="Geminigera cryophila, Strain CCMP2564" /LENGTH=175 /DNA_ID=CAMNT_0021220233 /DNA_START=69 /DNA_END=596 /DNA_ORIENTATION=+